MLGNSYLLFSLFAITAASLAGQQDQAEAGTQNLAVLDGRTGGARRARQYGGGPVAPQPNNWGWQQPNFNNYIQQPFQPINSGYGGPAPGPGPVPSPTVCQQCAPCQWRAVVPNAQWQSDCSCAAGYGCADFVPEACQSQGSQPTGAERRYCSPMGGR